MEIIITHLGINAYYDFDEIFENNTPIKNHIVEQDGTYTVTLKTGAHIRTTDKHIIISYNGINYELELYEFAQVRII